MRLKRLSLLVLGFTFAVACVNTQKDTRPSAAPAKTAAPNAPVAPPAPKAWTDKFQQRALLVADEVRIEGPDGLLDHVASSIDPETLTRTEKVTPDGFLTTIEHKTGAPPGEIKVQLDRTEIVALRRVVLLERPGPVDVVLSAKGDILWTDLVTKAESRPRELRIEGKVARGVVAPGATVPR